jgi:hypothetical protein
MLVMEQQMLLVQISLVRVLVIKQLMHLIQISWVFSWGRDTTSAHSQILVIQLVIKQQMLIIQISLVFKLVGATNAQYSTFIGQNAGFTCNWCI